MSPQGPTILRNAVKIVDKVTKALNFQAIVTYEQYSAGSDGYEGVYSAPVSLRAIVDYVSRQVRTQSGVLTVSRATITLLDVAAVKAATGDEGIGNNDRFTLPDGDTGPTLDIRGFVDAGTGNPVATEVVLG